MGRPKPNTNKPAIPGTTCGGRGNAANSTGSPAPPYPPPEVHGVPPHYATEPVVQQHYPTDHVAPLQHYATEPVAQQHYATEPVAQQHYATDPQHRTTEPMDLHYTTEPVEPYYATESVAQHYNKADEPQHYDEADEPQHDGEADEPQHYLTEPDEPQCDEPDEQQHYAIESNVSEHYDESDEQHYATEPVEPQHYATQPVESQPVPHPPAQSTPYPPPVQPVPYPTAGPTIGVPQYYNIAPDETQPVPYPPAVPYPPPPASNPPAVPYPRPPASPLRPAAVGTPVQFPPPAQPDKNNFPTYAYAGTDMAEQWSSELYECDMSQDYVITTSICPCVTFGQIAEIVDEGQTSCLLAGIIYMVMIPALFTCSVLSSGYRQKLREKYNLVEAPHDDCSVHLMNPCCALCQEYRELQMRGFNPSLGWIANVAQQQQDTSMAPPGNQFMSR